MSGHLLTQVASSDLTHLSTLETNHKVLFLEEANGEDHGFLGSPARGLADFDFVLIESSNVKLFGSS